MIRCDDVLKTIFDNEDTVSMFAMNKYYGKHLKATGRVIAKSKRTGHVATAKKKKKRRKKNGERKNNNMPSRTLSKDMSNVCGGETQLKRTEVVKKIWEYIKSNDLQNPDNRREILCDDALKRIFDGQEKVTMFSLNKYISKHLT